MEEQADREVNTTVGQKPVTGDASCKVDERQKELRGLDLCCHGLHGGLQVSEQVKALVEEGELSVDIGEHLLTHRNTHVS